MRTAPLSRGQVTIQTSRDPVGAPIFYRDVPLMPSAGENGVIKPLAAKAVPLIAWRLRNISEAASRVMMTGLHTCANCHSFSRDGKTLGMDLDGPQNDKGLYAIVPIQPQMSIRNEDVIAWSSFRGKLGSQMRVGFMSQVSPDGQYVVTTVKPPGTDRPAALLRRQFQGLPLSPGVLSHARNPGLVRPRHAASAARCPAPTIRATCRPTPSGVRTASTWCSRAPKPRTPIPKDVPAGRIRQRSERDADPVRPLPHSLQRRPGRHGRSRSPAPRTNGMSNSFPKISPDGRWIVFVQARNGQLMRPDSKLYIVPAEGGAGAADALQHAADEFLAQLLAQRPLAGLLLQEPLALHADVPHAHRRERQRQPAHPDREFDRGQSRREHPGVREHSAGRHGGRTQSVLIVNRHTQPLHQRPRVLAEPLLTRNQRVAVVRVFHRALLEIVRHADIVVRAEDQARAFAFEPLAHRFDFLRRRFLLGDQ